MVLLFVAYKYGAGGRVDGLGVCRSVCAYRKDRSVLKGSLGFCEARLSCLGGFGRIPRGSAICVLRVCNIRNGVLIAV